MTGFVDERSSGAVVADIDDEVQRLESIQLRNKRIARNPLSAYFLDDLLEPLELREFGAAVYLRQSWHTEIAELEALIARAIERLWNSLDLVYRPRASGLRNPNLIPSEVMDCPRWAHEAATGLLTRSHSIFGRDDDTSPIDGDLLDMAHSYVPQSRRFTDMQVFTCLAVAEATKALRVFGNVVTDTESDSDVSHWLKHWQKYDIQKCPVRRRMYGEEVAKRIAAILPEHLAPSRSSIIYYWIHAEKLMLLADALAGGMLSPQAATKLAMEAARDREQVQKRSETLLRNARAGANARRKLTDEVLADMRQAADVWRNENPSGLQKALYATLAADFSVSIDSVKRALGKK